MSEIEKRFYSVDEANNLIPEISKKIEELQEIHKAINVLNSVEVTFDEGFSNLIQEVKQNMKSHKLYSDFYDLYYGLLEVGAIIKDVEEGLVDFYSMHEDNEIFLCWKFGEENIRFWHEVESDFKGRKPISLLTKNG